MSEATFPPQRRRGAEKARRSKFGILCVLLCVFASLRGKEAHAQHPNFDDDIKPLFARRCLACHSAGEMRSGLNLETYSGVLKGASPGAPPISPPPPSSLPSK